jgi:hypothetical protein
MGCRSLFLVLALVMGLGGWVGSLAQNLSGGGLSCCRITDVNFGHSRFDYRTAPPQWTVKDWPQKSRIIVETVQPASSSKEVSGVLPTNQIPHFGGFLQYFANRTDTTTASGIRPPFGGNIVVPLVHGRIEIFGGIGGVYFQPTISFHPGTAYVRRGVPYVQPDSWLMQGSFGGRAALDPEHHFWLGASTYYLVNFADKTRRWSSSSADFAVRFGR